MASKRGKSCRVSHDQEENRRSRRRYSTRSPIFHLDQQKNERFLESRVLPGRVIDFNFLHGIEFPYLHHFEDFGWTSYLKFNRCAYTHLVKIFYSNAIYDDEGQNTGKFYRQSSFTTYVKGKIIRLTKDKLGRVLGLPNEGEEYVQDFNKLEACRVVFENPTLEKVEHDTNKLSMHNRILHLIVSQVLNPRAGKFGRLSREDLWLMWKIMSRNPPNLCHFMVTDMISVFTTSTTSQKLIYGMAISALLDSEGIDMVGESKEFCHVNSYLSWKTPRSMGYIRRSGSWIKVPGRGDGDRGVDDDEEIPEQEHDDVPRMDPPQKDSLSDVLSWFDDISGQLVCIMDQLSRMEERQIRLEQHIYRRFPPYD